MTRNEPKTRLQHKRNVHPSLDELKMLYGRLKIQQTRSCTPCCFRLSINSPATSDKSDAPVLWAASQTHWSIRTWLEQYWLRSAPWPFHTKGRRLFIRSDSTPTENQHSPRNEVLCAQAPASTATDAMPPLLKRAVLLTRPQMQRPAEAEGPTVSLSKAFAKSQTMEMPSDSRCAKASVPEDQSAAAVRSHRSSSAFRWYAMSSDERCSRAGRSIAARFWRSIARPT